MRPVNAVKAGGNPTTGGSVWPLPAQLQQAQVHQWQDYRGANLPGASGQAKSHTAPKRTGAVAVTKPPSLHSPGEKSEEAKTHRKVTIVPLKKSKVATSPSNVPASGSYEQVERLALRFLNPPSYHGGQSSAGGGVFEVTGVEEIQCLDQKKTFDSSKAQLVGKNHCVVAKFLPSYDREYLSLNGTLNDTASSCDVISGPNGPGFYFPNTFSADGSCSAHSSPDRYHCSPQAGRGVEEHGELLLCEVAQGSICLNPSQLVQGGGAAGSASSVVPSPTRLSLIGKRGTTPPSSNVNALASTSLGDTPTEVKTSLRKKGFDSVAASVLGQAHVAVFDTDVILPTHIISFYRRPNVVAAPRESSPTQAPTGAETEKDNDEGQDEVQLGKWVNDERSSVKLSAKQLRDMVHRRCADLEQSIRARRDVLLANIRKAEESELTALGKMGSKATGCETVPAWYQDQQQLQKAQYGIRAATLDTSRVMALLETLEVQCLNPPQSRPGSSNRSRRVSASQDGSSPALNQQQFVTGGPGGGQHVPSRPSTSGSAVRPPLGPQQHQDSSSSQQTAQAQGVQALSKQAPVKAMSPVDLSSSTNNTASTSQRQGTGASHTLGARPATSPGPGKPPQARVAVSTNGGGPSGNNTGAAGSSLAKPLWGKGSGPRQLAQATGRKPPMSGK